MDAVQANRTPWYLGRRFRLTAIVIMVGFVIGAGVVGILLKDNDFEWHRGLGQAFLEGEPYANGGYHYLPARPMLNALTAWLPYRVDRAIVYLVAIAALAWTVLAWSRLAHANDHPALAFAAAVFALVIGVTYIQRDLDECGLQILLLFFLTAAVVALQAGRHLQCGFWLGLSVVYKLTPLLFLPYLCFKREWKAAAATVVCTAGLSLAPAVYLGWDGNVRAHDVWWTYTWTCLTTPNPTENSIQPPTHRNQALSLAVTRFLQTYPPEHPLYLDHPLFAQFGDLEPATAKRVVQGSILLLAAVLAWRVRRRFTEYDPQALPREWAAVAIFTAILSPFCWLQHLVLVLPALLLGTRAYLDGGMSRLQRTCAYALAVITIVAGQRDLLGHGLFMVLMSYKLPTFAALGCVFLVLWLPKRKAAIQSQRTLAESSVHPLRHAA